jgi:sec-independent protein translocase protein TatA
MFGTIGTPEMMVIFVLALLLFGPKKLPELGRTLGKAITEFRRASSELKSTFDREMQNLEAETQLREVKQDLQLDTYNYDYSSSDHSYDGGYHGEYYDGSADLTPTESASAPQDAQLSIAAPPEGAIARGSGTESSMGPEEKPSEQPAPATAEHNA